MLRFVHSLVKLDKHVLKAPNSCKKFLLQFACLLDGTHANNMQHLSTNLVKQPFKTIEDTNLNNLIDDKIVFSHLGTSL